MSRRLGLDTDYWLLGCGFVELELLAWPSCGEKTSFKYTQS